MSGQSSWAVVKDHLTIQARSVHEVTVKQSLTVQVEPACGPTTDKSSVVQKEQP
jgi:hypothetical protein